MVLSGFHQIAVVVTGYRAGKRLGLRPQSVGAPSSKRPLLVFISAVISLVLVFLMGCGGGNAAIQKSATLSWTADAPPVAGYNVYRGLQSGGPYSRINSVLEVPPSYVDHDVKSGWTYYYVVTAVDSSGLESAYSKEVVAIIP